MTGIYRITNKINGKGYIGQSVDISRRISEHKNLKRDETLSLKRAFRKYGVENFNFEVLEECALDQLDEREVFWINELKPEYNRTIGGTGAKGHVVTDEAKNIIRVKTKEWWNSLSDEQRQSVIKNNLKGPAKGHTVDETTREKLRIHNLGKKQSVDTIEKRKATFEFKKKNGYKQTNAGHNKKVLCIETGETFDSVKAAAESLGVDPSNISGVIKGRYKTCKGYHFKLL